MAIARGHVEVVRRDTEGRTADDLGVALDELDRMALITKNLLALSRAQDTPSLSPEPLIASRPSFSPVPVIASRPSFSPMPVIALRPSFAPVRAASHVLGSMRKLRST